jgi:hypothetical protein
VKAIDGGGAEFRGMKIKEWKIDEHRVVVAVRFDWFGWLVWLKIKEWKIDNHRVLVAIRFDWFGWLVWLKDPVFSFYYSVIIFFFV